MMIEERRRGREEEGKGKRADRCRAVSRVRLDCVTVATEMGKRNQRLGNRRTIAV